MAKRLTLYILIGLVLGLALGWGIHVRIDDGTPAATAKLTEIAGYFSILTTLFLRLIRMIIAPLVFSTLVVGIAHMGDTGALGRVGLRSLAWFICASLMSLTLGLVLVHILQPGVGLGLPLPPVTADSGVAKTAFNLKDFLTHVIPASMFEAMATNEIIQIVVFSVFVGVAITAVGEKAAPLVRATEALVAVMLQITNYVMRFAPVAVFAAVASTLVERGPGVIGDLGYFMLSFYIGLALLWILLIAIGYLFIGKRNGLLIRYIRDPLILAFTTASSEAAYPAHARGARSVRGAAQDRELRAAARLFVQPRRLDDVHDLRVAVHRPGVRHPPDARRADHDAAGADGHVQGDRRRAAREPGGDRGDAAAVQDSRGRAAPDPGGRPFPGYGTIGDQRDRQRDRGQRRGEMGRRSRSA